MSTPKSRLDLVANHLAQTAADPKPLLCCKVCIVTGAGSEQGIGRAAAWSFAKHGAKAVYVTDIREDLIYTLADDICTKYPHVTAIARKVDASSEDDVQTVVKEALQRFGRLDVFFANAGILGRQDITSVDARSFMNMIKITSLSALLAVKHASAAMKVAGGKDGKEAAGGSIILTASVAGLRSGAGGGDYSAAKAAVVSLAQTGACHLAGTNVRVNAICPGLVETNMTKALFDHARARGTSKKIGQLNPLLRPGSSDEIANVATFLASDMSSYVNGQAIAVDGGLSATLPVVPGKWVA